MLRKEKLMGGGGIIDPKLEYKLLFKLIPPITSTTYSTIGEFMELRSNKPTNLIDKSLCYFSDNISIDEEPLYVERVCVSYLQNHDNTNEPINIPIETFIDTPILINGFKTAECYVGSNYKDYYSETNQNSANNFAIEIPDLSTQSIGIALKIVDTNNKVHVYTFDDVEVPSNTYYLAFLFNYMNSVELKSKNFGEPFRYVKFTIKASSTTFSEVTVTPSATSESIRSYFDEKDSVWYYLMKNDEWNSFTIESTENINIKTSGGFVEVAPTGDEGEDPNKVKRIKIEAKFRGIDMDMYPYAECEISAQ